MHYGDEIHDGVGVFERRIDRVRKAHVRLHELDLADVAHHAQLVAKMRAAHGDAHAIAALRQRAHNLFTDETGTAEHNDEIARS